MGVFILLEKGAIMSGETGEKFVPEGADKFEASKSDERSEETSAVTEKIMTNGEKLGLTPEEIGIPEKEKQGETIEEKGREFLKGIKERSSIKILNLLNVTLAIPLGIMGKTAEVTGLLSGWASKSAIELPAVFIGAINDELYDFDNKFLGKLDDGLMKAAEFVGYGAADAGEKALEGAIGAHIGFEKILNSFAKFGLKIEKIITNLGIESIDKKLSDSKIDVDKKRKLEIAKEKYLIQKKGLELAVDKDEEIIRL